MTYNARVQQKLDTSAGWSASSITLLDGELALVRDNGKTRIKVGDGKTAYASLPFLDQDAVTHIANKENPHGVTKAQVGLGNVNNTADSEKTVKAANALTVVSKGSATKPVYFNASGVPVACTYSLGANVPSDAKFTDTVYTHPESHPASMITGLATVATSGSYTDLTNKPTIPTSLPADGGNSDTVNGHTVLSDVPEDAKFTDTVYTHPTYTAKSSGLYKITVNNLGHVSGATAVAKSDITALGIPAQDTVYTHPDTHAATMITGLADVATSGSYNDLSNKPTIPTSLPANGGNAATVGGFTVGTNVPADAVFTDTVYTLPNATTSTLGGVKVGTNISVSSGTISVANASTSAKGVVQLTNSTSSTSTTTAATPAAVKSAYDLANGKQSPATTLSGYGITDAYTKTEVDSKVAGLVDSAPEALNTLNELAAALGDDPNFATTMSTAIGKKANTADLAKVATSGSYNDLSNKPTIPTSLPANGGNAATVGGFTVGTNVPAGAVFTDTVYTHPTYTAKSSGLYKITVNNLGHVSAATAVAKADITGLGIPAQDTVYTHPSHTAKSSGLYKITVDALGHVSAATAVAKADITGLGIPAQDTVYTHPSTHAASMITGLATVATSGSYNDLSNKPTIPKVNKVTFTASDSKWGALSNGRYPLTISASGGEFLNCYRTNGSNYDKMDVNVTVSGNNIIIYSLDKFAGYMTYIK